MACVCIVLFIINICVFCIVQTWCPAVRELRKKLNSAFIKREGMTEDTGRRIGKWKSVSPENANRGNCVPVAKMSIIKWKNDIVNKTNQTPRKWTLMFLEKVFLKVSARSSVFCSISQRKRPTKMKQANSWWWMHVLTFPLVSVCVEFVGAAIHKINLIEKIITKATNKGICSWFPANTSPTWLDKYSAIDQTFVWQAHFFNHSR